MRITCPTCQAAYNVDERRLPAAGLNVRCPKCHNAFPVRPPQAAGAEGEPVPLPTGAAPAAPASQEGLGGATARFASPFAAPPPAPPVPPPPAPPPPAPEVGSGDHTMRFERPFDAGPRRLTPPMGSVPLPSPAAGAPPPVPLAFGEVELPGAGGDQGGFEAEPFPVPPDLPPLSDPFAAPPPPPATEPPDLPPPDAPEPASFGGPAAAGLGSLGPQAAEELEALFEESGGAPPARPASRPPPAPRAEGGSGWSIRRRSGKVFGPFPEAEVVQMLSRGELLGNEEVSSDGASWAAIGEVAAFGQAIRTLIDRPAEGKGSRPAPVVGPALAASDDAPAAPRGPGLLERLRARLATLPAWSRWLLPAAVAGLVLGAGLAVGLGDNGIFFHRLIRGQVGPNRPGARLCQEARQRLAEDSWAGARAAVELTRQAVGLSPVDREAKGLFVQAVAWMARRTGVAPDLTAQARSWATEIQERAPRAPDTLKARLSLALVPGGGTAPDAAAELEKGLERTPADEDAAQWLGEAALARGDAARAEALFQRIEKQRPSARVAHARGLAAASAGDLAGARARFEEALSRDPRHLSSALELATLAAAAGDAAEVERRLSAALAGGEALGPRERARARQLRGELLARQLGEDPAGRLAEAEKELEGAVKEDGSWLPARAALARFLLRRNAPDRALQALQPALAGAGAEVVDLQARALAATGRVLDAVTALDAAAARGPSPRLTYVKGWVLEQGGKTAEAEKLYAEAAKDAAYWEPHLALGRLKLRAGDLAAAAPELQQAAERAPAEPDAQAGLASLRFARGDMAGASEAWRKALALDPAHAPSHLGLARVAMERGEPATAALSLEKAARFDPRLAEAQLLLGTLRWQGRDLPGAAAALAAAVTIDPGNARARTRLGAVQLEQGQVDAAVSSLMAASNVDVAMPENRYWLGRALLAKGEAVPAAEQLAKAVSLDPAKAVHQLWLGAAQEKAAKLEEAGEAYRAALELDPRLAEAAERLGLLKMTLGQAGEAVPYFEKAIQLAPREPRLRMELADCRMKLNQAPQAIQIYKDALKADPKLTVLFYRIARAVHDSQGEKAAVPWYERAVKEDPDNPMPHYYLGFQAKLRGKRAKAVEFFRNYLRLKPEAEDRKDIEREIEDLGG